MTANKINIIPELFASIVSIVAGILIYISGLGFDYSNLLILESVSVALCLIHTPHNLLLFIRNNNKLWYYSKSFMLLSSLLVLVILGYIDRFVFRVSIPASILGIVFFLMSLKNIISSYKFNYKLIIIFFLLGVFFVTVYYANYFIHPLMREKIITGSWAHRDPLWFAAMAGMYKTYGVSSNGLDGLVPVYYHNFSHFVYGAFSNILDISTLTFFKVVVPIVVIPVFMFSFLLCVKEVANYFTTNYNYPEIDETKLYYWLAFAVLFLLPLPYQLINRFGGDTYQYLGSSSYNFALLMTFISISLIFSYLNSTSNKQSFSYNKIFLIITIVGLYFVISTSKVSFLFVIGAIYGYLFLRLKYFTDIFHIICMAGFLLVVAFVYVYLLNTETFLKNPFQVESSEISFISYIFYSFPSLFYIIIKMYSIEVKSIKGFIKNFKSNNLLDIEILIFLIVILFPLTYQYFKGIQIYFAYILIMSHASLFKASLFGTSR
jgi:hypothetical protein